MMTLARKANHNSHHQHRSAFVVPCDNTATTGKVRQLKSLNYVIRTSSLFRIGTLRSNLRDLRARRSRALHCASNSQVQSRDCWRSIHTILRSSPVSSLLRRGRQCVQSSVENSKKSKGRFCERQFRNRNANKFKAKGRTNLSVQSLASMVSASTSASSRGWRGRTRRNPISHSSPASMRAPRAVGLLTITNRPHQFSASCSRRLCGDFTSVRRSQ